MLRFKKKDLIKLRESMGSFPLTTELPVQTGCSNYFPFYLGPHHAGFVSESDVLIVLDVFSKKREMPYAYECLFQDKIVFIVNFSSEGIDPNFCFVKCN